MRVAYLLASWTCLLAAALARGAEPAPCVFRDVDIPAQPYNLHGTLVSPREQAKATCIIIPGSGPVRRDGTFVGVAKGDPFYLNLASALAQRGIATFLYDKRWITHPELAAKYTEEDALSDVAAIRTWFEQKLAGRSLFILGHSEGGTLAVVHAARNRGLSGVICVSSVGFPVDELLLAQNEGNPKLQQEIRELIGRMKRGNFPKGGVMLGASADYWMQWIGFTSDLPNLVRSIQEPILVLQGLNDETLPGKALERNIEAWQAMTISAKRARFVTLEGVNHLLIDRTAHKTSRALVDNIASFIEEQAAK